MNPFLIAAIVLGGLILLILLLLFAGKAKIRIVCREKIKVVASVLGIRYTLVSDKEPKPPKHRDLSRCLHPDRVLRRELRKQRKESAKAWKKQLKEQRKAEKKALKKHKKKQLQQQTAQKKPTPNLKEKLEMIFALLKQLYLQTKGKFCLQVRRMHIRVGSDNAADTAILYGVAVSSTSCILQWLQDHFIPIRRKDGSIQIQPDYLSEKTHADIDIVCSVRLYRALGIGIRMLIAYKKENRRAHRKALRRAKSAKSKRK